jgi:hypothetical protein
MNERETRPPSASALGAQARVLRASALRDAPQPERVLWCLSRRTLTQTAKDELSALAHGLDQAGWRHLLALAQMHGVAPLAFQHLAQTDLLGSIPSPIASAFKETYIRTLINNRRMQTVFREVAGALTAAGIPVMPLKGLALAQRYYGDLALRPMTDLDLLVSRQNIPLAASVLRRLGFRAADGMGSPSGFYALTSAVVVYARSHSLSIEVHWELFGRQVYRPSLPASAAWSHALDMRVFDQRVRYLHPRDEIWYLCVHAAIEHHLERLIWLVDIAELVDALPASWDWHRFARETSAAGVALPVVAALGYCCAHLGLAVPSDALEHLYAAAEAPQELARCVRAQADLLSAEWIQMAAASVRGPREAAIFLRGVLAPRRATLEALYGHDAARWHALPMTYTRHWRRTAAAAAHALRAKLTP